MSGDEYSVRTVAGAGAFTPEEWSRLEGTARGAVDYNPFISHAFLTALEQSGCVSRRAGWQPHFLRIEDGGENLVAAVPAYLKSHSQGEYVFDHGWANAFEQAGGSYYPKLQVSVPFTPATGPRLLSVEGDRTAKLAAAKALKAVAKSLGVSSAHVTFATEIDAAILESQGFLHRIDQQFHFHNDNYKTYDDFLATLASRKRKGLRKERDAALSSGISIDRLTGSQITEEIWDQFFNFYIDTGNRKWGQPYLTRKFFSLIGQSMADDILLIMAKRDGRYIAGAINFLGGGRIFGRNWGCIEDHPFLHFEVCYHQAIDHAIEHGYSIVEAGAQGEHKLARGYMPVTTHSAHYIVHEGLRRAVADYLERERQEVSRMSEVLTELGPFRKGALLPEN
jgi:uncharacterized protein